MRTRTTIAAILAAAALALSGCGDDSGDDSTEGGGSGPTFNQADVAFAQGMIPHHEQAIEMAELAASRASDPEVKQLAEDIEAAQGPEIETMTGWLEEWGEDVPIGGDMDDMDHGEMSEDGSMPGMMSDQQMADLSGAMGMDFDMMFLAMMTEHHQGAIEMAMAEQEDGKNPDCIALAERIETAQQGEITDMQDMMAMMGGMG
jgi:uncharacterized protein (DUF305 family)